MIVDVDFVRQKKAAFFGFDFGDIADIDNLWPAERRLIFHSKKNHTGAEEKNLAVIKSSWQMRNNNAELIVVDRRAAKYLIDRRNYRHAKYLVVSFSTFFTVYGLVALMRYSKRRWKYIGKLVPFIDGRGFYCFELLKRQIPAQREYLSRYVGHMGMISRFESYKINYVVLRYSENLPNWPVGDDIDILVSDLDASRARKLFDEEIGDLPVDLYAVSGGDASGGDRIAYFPPVMADRILRNSIVNQKGVRVPNPIDAFFSFAYHVVYQKGFLSGLESSVGGGAEKSYRDYENLLRKYAHAANIMLPHMLTLENLERILSDSGWRPPTDMLAHLSLDNPWILKFFFGDRGSVDEGLGVIVIREGAELHQKVEEIINEIKKVGFDILDVWVIPKVERKNVAMKLRGGNWSKGSDWAADGGGPAVFVSIFDKNPIRPTRKQLKSAPTIKNARLLEKRGVRIRVNSSILPEQRANFIHAADNSMEATDYIQSILPKNRVRRIQELAESYRRN